MKKILAFSGSNSSTSINQQLVSTAAKQVTEVEVELIDLREFPAPLYGKDLEKEKGIPAPIKQLKAKFDEADGFLISSPEHNGSIPAFFKNTIDWLSRIEAKLFLQKPVVLMATSPGKNGGATNLNTLKNLVPHWGAKLVETYSLPSFSSHLTDNELNDDVKNDLSKVVKALERAV